MKKIMAIAVVSLLFAGCASKPVKKPEGDVQDAVLQQHLNAGQGFVSAGSLQKAVNEFDQAIAICEVRYSAQDRQVFASRSTEETVYYMVLAAATAPNKNAIAVNVLCSDALYLRGYSALDMGQVPMAKTYIERAVAMAPANSMYLSELGHIHQTNKQWNESLAVFVESESAAETYSPKAIKQAELLRAKRGVAFNLIELGRLDEAEAKFKECLKIDSNDKKSLGELQYIKSLRGKKS